MENKVERLWRKYKGFKKGVEDVLAVRNEALLVLKEAIEKENTEVVEEGEDMLIDLEFSIEENKCKCHRKCSSC